MMLPGDRIRVLSGANTGKVGEVLRELKNGRVLVFLDGTSTSEGLRAYVPASLELETPPVPDPDPTPDPEPEPDPDPTPDPEPEPEPEPTPEPDPVPTPTAGIWISPAEILKLPTTGAAFNALKTVATGTWATPNLSDQDNQADVQTYAGALYAVRTGDTAIRAKVIQQLVRVQGTEAGSRSLALGRGLLAYILAADIIDYRDPIFTRWVAAVRTFPTSGGPVNLIDCHNKRPNNWGCHAGASRIAAALYLGDTEDLAKAIQVFKGYTGDRAAYAGFAYGDLAWQANPAAPVGVNPKGATKSGHSIDGVVPDDQRRAGGFTWPPPKENYVYEGLQGLVAQAELLRRAGYASFEWNDRAVLRAYTWLRDVAQFNADGDDSWQLHIVNRVYGTSFPAGDGVGKNVGFTNWTHAPNPNGGSGSDPEPTPTPEPDPTPEPGPVPGQGGAWPFDVPAPVRPTKEIVGQDFRGVWNYELQPDTTYVNCKFRTIGSARNLWIIGGEIGPSADSVHSILRTHEGVVLDGVYIHDMTNAPAPNDHTEGVQVSGIKRSIIRNCRFRNNCVFNVFVRNWLPSVNENILIENNDFGPTFMDKSLTALHYYAIRVSGDDVPPPKNVIIRGNRYDKRQSISIDPTAAANGCKQYDNIPV